MIRYRDLISIGVKEGFYEDEGDTDTDTDTNTDTDSSDSSYRPSDSDGSTSSGSCEEFEVRAERRVINLLFRCEQIIAALQTLSKYHCSATHRLQASSRYLLVDEGQTGVFGRLHCYHPA